MQTYRDCYHKYYGTNLIHYTDKNVKSYLKFLQCMQQYKVQDFFQDEFIYQYGIELDEHAMVIDGKDFNP